MDEIMIRLKNMDKSFGVVHAVADVSLEIKKGEVRALIGENGSGKSTLVSLIIGSQAYDSGSIVYLGEHFEPKGLIDSRSKGIAVLQQEKGTVDGLTVAENILLGNESLCKGKLGVSGSAMNKMADDALKAIGAGSIDASKPIDTYSFEERKLVEVARAVFFDPQILIVDETTTALSLNGRNTIYEIVKKMKEKGRTVIFISHDLEEVCSVCDSATILRDGRYIDTVCKEKMKPELLRPLMIGRELVGSFYREDTTEHISEKVVLEAEEISLGNTLHDVSFSLHEGEILGLGGLTECGMHELCKVIFGALKPDHGSVYVVSGNERILIDSCETAISNKIAYLPKDRDAESLFSSASIRDNIVVSSISKVSKGIYISPKKEKELSDKEIKELSVKCVSDKQYISELSGGNKQKVVVGKWLANDSKILIMDCPTRGIDVGVKSAIYSLMEELVSQGRSIIMVSEELPELIGMSDRILILKNGKMSGTFLRSERPSEQSLVEYII